MTASVHLDDDQLIATRQLDAEPELVSQALITPEHLAAFWGAPNRLLLTEPRTGITTEIRLQPSGSGTTVGVHQRRLPAELQTERARTGLVGILERLDGVVRKIPSD